MSRTNRLLGGASLGALNMAVAAILGLWLTRFYLHRLGQQQLGFWLIATQIISYLSIIDFGVVALLPRQTAYAVGKAGGWRAAEDLPDLLGGITRIVLCQVPVLAIAMVGIWVWLPEAWAPVREPLAYVFVAFVLLFPLRIPAAVLQGLQDLSYLGVVQLVSWSANAVTTVALLIAGFELSAFAIGYVLSQLLSAGLALTRLLWKYPGVLPRRLRPNDRSFLKDYLRRGAWTSASQIAWILLSGSEMLIIGSIIGPSAVVIYSCTAKLLSVLGNLPAIILQTAPPGLAELRNSGRQRFAAVSATLALAVLLASGIIAAAVIGANGAFVGWWVGSAQYGGLALTVAFATQTVLRHLTTSVSTSVFALGHERFLALVALAEGVVKIVLAFVLLRRFGILGVPLASLTAMLTVTLPASLVVFARDTHEGFWHYPRALLPFAIRFGLVAGAAALLSINIGGGFVPAALAASGTALAYAVVVLPLAFREPLGAYVRPRIAPVLRRVGLGRWTDPSAHLDPLAGKGQGTP